MIAACRAMAMAAEGTVPRPAFRQQFRLLFFAWKTGAFSKKGTDEL
jgi:hypothetical protein